MLLFELKQIEFFSASPVCLLLCRLHQWECTRNKVRRIHVNKMHRNTPCCPNTNNNFRKPAIATTTLRSILVCLFVAFSFAQWCVLFLFVTIVFIVYVRVCIDRDRRVQQVNSLGLFWWRFTNFSPLNDTRMFLVVAREQYGPTLAAKITDNMVLDEDEETIGQGWFKISSTHACWSTYSLFSFHV